MTEKITPQTDDRLFWSFLIFLVWIPLPLGSNRPWAVAILEIWAFLIATFWLIKYHKGLVTPSYLLLRSAPILAPLLLWLGWLIIQIVPLPMVVVKAIGGRLHTGYDALSEVGMGSAFATLSIDPYATGNGVILTLALIVVFVLVLQFASSHRRIRNMGQAIVFSGLFQAVYGALMTLSGADLGLAFERYLNEDVASGTFVNRNHLAGYLEMALAVGIGLLIAELRGGEKAYGWRQRLRGGIHVIFSRKARLRLFLVMMVITLVLTHSRMGNTAFFSSLLITGVIGLIFSRHATRSTVVLLSSLVVIDIFIVGTFFGVEKVAKRLEETRLERETRDEVDAYSLKLIQEHKIFGTGLGSFATAFMPYREQDVVLYYDYAHNDYLQFAAETGLIGVALLGVAVLISLISALVAQAKRHDPLLRGLSFSAIMGGVALMIHSTVDYNLQIPANATTFMVILAFGWTSLKYKVNP